MAEEDVPQAKPTPAKPLVFKPRPEAIRNLVRSLAANTANIKWSKHALERMGERDISDRVVVAALRNGMVKGDVEQGANPGEWKVKMTYRVKGSREVGVVAITVRDKCLLVKTVEWEDPR